MRRENPFAKKISPAEFDEGFFVREKFLICSERQERNVAGAFNGDCHLTLMLGAVARNAARQNFSALGGEAAELGRVFVIYLFNFIDAKRTNFSARASTSFSAHVQSSLKGRVVRVNRFTAEIVIIVSLGRRGRTIGIIFFGGRGVIVAAALRTS